MNQGYVFRLRQRSHHQAVYNHKTKIIYLKVMDEICIWFELAKRRVIQNSELPESLTKFLLISIFCYFPKVLNIPIFILFRCCRSLT
jgi:hypothetical protein